MVREEGEAASRCVNTDCPARLKESILHFASRGVMDIDGMGEALVDQLVDRGLVKSVVDIYHLSAAQLMDLDRMGKKSAEKLLANIERSKELPLPRVLNALGIRFVGERTAQLLAEHFGSMDAIAEADPYALADGRRGRAQGGREHPAVLPRGTQLRADRVACARRASIHLPESAQEAGTRWPVSPSC